MKLQFYIDPEHYPYAYQDNLSFNNGELLTELGSANTWLLWTLRTYLELKSHFTCVLVDKMPESGITLFSRGSVNLTQKPKRGQFWVCMVADGTWHPYSHVNLFQNKHQIKNNPQSYFIRHWYQIGIIRSVSENKTPVNIYYFGDTNNLAAELKSDDWNKFVDANSFKFLLPPVPEWNNYEKADIVLGIRSFEKNNRYDNKPSSKLINAWRAGVAFIGGQDSAFEDERQSKHDFVSVNSCEDLKKALLKLKDDPQHYHDLRFQAGICAERFPDAFFVNQWTDLLWRPIEHHYQKAQGISSLAHHLFIVGRWYLYKSRALALRLKMR
ncbi:MAG: hypothetical protein JWR09_960 [Mucilaginibacter sp.]|nr:hypothetical protein [Mucilaginibacter sp.]